ncbi:uncharacterized membrane protein YuzA (DUF378 family) [Bacillus fengqiuensis]|nr:uncharacterized membrane protein YuzA (DUF378 family) [Bacillus fengqiuensis]
MRFLSGLTSLLVIIGGLNWLTVALGINVVEAWFGSWEWLVNTIYWLVGLSALYQIYDRFFASNGQSVKSKSQ